MVEFVKLPSLEQNSINEKYISMIDQVLYKIKIYYSQHEDLTRRLQGFLLFPILIRADTLCRPLSEEDHYFPTTADHHFLVPPISHLHSSSIVQLSNLFTPFVLFSYVTSFL